MAVPVLIAFSSSDAARGWYFSTNSLSFRVFVNGSEDFLRCRIRFARLVLASPYHD